jgi:mannosyltransferase
MTPADVEFDDIIYRLQANRGASVYWRELTAEVARRRPSWRVVHRPGRVLLRLAPVVTRSRIFHSSLFRVGVGVGTRNVVTIHDLTYEKGLVPGRRAQVGLAQRRLAVRIADGLVFISAHTRREFAEHYPRAVAKPSVVAWHGRDPTWDGGDERAADAAWELDGAPYLLHVGHRDAYKNFRLALDGYRASCLPGEGMPLVVLGPPLSSEETGAIAERGLAGRVQWRPASDRSELRRFMSNALALVYVSREEGFGMPIIEAMQCGTPVIAADASCLPEVAGGAALLVPPDDAAALAAAIDRVAEGIDRPELVSRGRERAEEFTWAASAEAHLSLYERLMTRSR